jgi:hypothetical protein
MNVLILETSPVAGCNPEICINANDSEFSVGVYVGVASYANVNEEGSNEEYVCAEIL